MKRTLTAIFFFLSASSIQAQSAIDQQADQILRAMGDFLAAAPSYSFDAEIGYDEFSDWGQEIQYGGNAVISVHRPNRLNVGYQGDFRHSRVVFDGKSLVFHDLVTNLFARMDAEGDIDNAVDELFARYGYSVPVADFVYANPYEVLIENAEFGMVIGQHVLPDGKNSHHLAFSGEVLDWQIWVEDGDQPLPRKIVITYKDEPGAPQYEARMDEWQMGAREADGLFQFTPDSSAGEMDFLPVSGMGTQEEDPQ